MSKVQLITEENGTKVEYHFAENNHIFVEGKTTFRETMCQVYDEFRHKGLYVTFINENSKVVTMYYNYENTDDTNFGNINNWKQINV